MMRYVRRKTCKAGAAEYIAGEQTAPTTLEDFGAVELSGWHRKNEFGEHHTETALEPSPVEMRENLTSAKGEAR